VTGQAAAGKRAKQVTQTIQRRSSQAYNYTVHTVQDIPNRP